ncbi:MAG: ECF transporter S component [Eubacteriales bacterium]|nr:ECF transporter S component [Eubacteriales bacterium]
MNKQQNYHEAAAHGFSATQPHDTVRTASERTRKLVTIAMLCAVAYVAMVLIHLKLMPAAPYLTYDPKDVIITIGGFLFGPLYALLISVIVAFLEMITVSDSGVIGFFMQVIATLAFAGTASLIYRGRHTKSGAVFGLVLGTVLMVVVMLLWNYILTPLYLGTPRTEVVKLLAPVILPFNLIKGLLNSVILLMIYKPIVGALRRSGLVNERK